MSVEIERKFLVSNDSWRKDVEKRILFRQGYMRNENHATIRIRIAGDRAYLTLKAPRDESGLERLEFEYSIPVSDAAAMLDAVCEKPLIEKYRNFLPAGNGLMWEIDEFLGDNAGLTVAELELPEKDTPFNRPDWLGLEVTGDPRYFNAMLTQHPYCQWQT